MKTTITEHPGNVWGVATVTQEGKVVREINFDYEIRDGYLTEYEASGGSGIGFHRGRPIFCMKLDEFEVVRFFS